MDASRELTGYRQPAPLPAEDLEEEVLVSRLRLANLERCEAVLEELEAPHLVYIDLHPNRPSRWRWSVDLYVDAGSNAHFYPIYVKGKGKTLREAVEEAKEWGPVEPWVEPERPPWTRIFATGLGIGFASGLLFTAFLSGWGVGLIGGWIFG